MTPSSVASYSRRRIDSCLFSCCTVRFSSTSLVENSSMADWYSSVAMSAEVDKCQPGWEEESAKRERRTLGEVCVEPAERESSVGMDSLLLTKGEPDEDGSS